MSEIVNVPMTAQRDIQTVTVEINTLFRQAQSMALSYIIEIGRRLCEAKEMLNHGQWGEWLKTEVPFKDSTAQSYMKIFREYGDKQISFFGDAKSQTIGNLPYTKALRLLTIGDEEEREAFIESHDVENMSTRELQEAIRERDAEKKRAEDAVERMLDAQRATARVEEQLRSAKGDVTNQFKAAQELQKKLTEAEARKKDAQDEAEKAKAQVKKAKEHAKDLQEKLKAAQENPEIPADLMDKLRAEMAEKAAQEAGERVHSAEEAARKASDEAEALKKQLAAADSSVAVFGVHFSTVQEDFAALGKAFTAVAEKDTEKAEKLRGAVFAVLDKLREEAKGW